MCLLSLFFCPYDIVCSRLNGLGSHSLVLLFFTWLEFSLPKNILFSVLCLSRTMSSPKSRITISFPIFLKWFILELRHSWSNNLSSYVTFTHTTQNISRGKIRNNFKQLHRIANVKTTKLHFTTMANSRAVVNPFTKNENRMRRNTRDSRWVSDNSGYRRPQQQTGPGKTAQYIPQQFQHVSHTPSMAAYPDEISPKARTHSPPLPQLQTSPPPVSPTFSDRTFHRDSPVSPIGPIDFSRPEERRKSSDVTVFPYFPSSIKKPELKSKKSWWKQGLNKSSNSPTATSGENMVDEGQASTSLADLYRTAKDIYQVGPKGEGQKIWTSYMQFRKEKQNHTEARQDISAAQAERPQTAPQFLAAAHSVHPALRPLPGQSHTTFDRARPKTPLVRQDSGLSEGEFSRSSYEVPLSIDQSIQQAVDVNKPLPPVPQLQPAPRTRHLMDLESAFKVGIAAASMQHPTQRRGESQRPERDQPVSKETHSGPWWKALADKQTTKAHAALKAKISHTRPLTAFNNGRTANVATECGGVGGPGAATSLPVSRNGAPTSQTSQAKDKKQVKRPPPLNLSEQQKGKQKARHETHPMHWREMFDTATKGKKRKDSDTSFACQGLPESYPAVNVRDPGTSTQFQMERRSFDTDDRDFVPGPLFAGRQGDDDGRRDTRFYQPYYDVLGEY